MIQQRIQEWIEHPEFLNKDSLFELRAMLARYPYFQTVRLLYLKNLFLLQEPCFREELRRSVLYIADLSVLFYYIEGERFVIKKHDATQEGETGRISDRTLDLIDRFLSDMSEQPSESSLPIQTEVSVDYTSILLQEDSEDVADVQPLKGQELIDSFIERGKVSSAIAEDENDDTDLVTTEDEAVALEADRRLEDETEDVLHAEDTDERYFTETLAKIYVKQQRYDKALEIIKKLNLKYPKKNAYFADQIRFLEKLIINAKSK
ncbi:tetratricopeptide repeat protein [uncultured Bacteroides sp.]|uniref:tetratricopeptide repeat protein n=1 Tax=uncultured Bacteroides sp. TaxID=162156 RepID=UPI00260603E9|nr:tetratricopeptide repeat protein [uncultured Bacteroides sp.]